MYFGFEQITVAYGRHIVLRDLTLDVPRGAISVLIGKNGCGKSSLLGTVSRTVVPRGGRVVLEGRTLSDYTPREQARLIAYLSQMQTLPTDIDVRTLVAYGRYPHSRSGRGMTATDIAAIDRALELTGLTALSGRPLGTLSGGERQRARIALCLAQEAQILLLDEPTTHLDIGHSLEVLELVRRLSREMKLTVLMVLHDLNLAARYADRLYAMADGAIVASGCPDDVLTEDVVHAAFGIDAEILRDETHGCPYILPKMPTWGDMR